MYPYRQKELIQVLNDKIRPSSPVTSGDVQAVVATERVKRRAEWFYQGKVAGSPGQYSRRFAVRIPLNPIIHSGVFDHPRSEAAERPTRGLVHPLMVTSSRWSADSLARRRWSATVGIREGHRCLPGADAAVLGRLWRADPA